jgi:integrase
MTEWFKTTFPGVRYRKHPSRKNGVKWDQYFTIRYKSNGKDKEEGLGWASEEWTAEKAYDQLNEIRQNIKTGSGPQSMAEKRDLEKQRKEDVAKEKELAKIEATTFKQYFEENYYPVAKTHKKESTYSKEEDHFRLWLGPEIGRKPLKEVSHLDIQRVKKKMLDAGKSPRYVQYVMATARQVWNAARRDGLVNVDSPTRSVKIPKFDNRRQRFLSPAEADLLLSTLKKKNEQVYRMCLLSLYTGMRASEVFHLTWGCVDTDRGIITILDTKSGKNRPAFMTEEVKAMFEGMTRGKHNELVFPHSKAGAYTEIPALFRDTVKHLQFNSDITDTRQRVCFHSLRHTFGSWHAEAGTDLYVIKSLLGHGSITLTERYSHLSRGSLQKATRNIEQTIEKAKQKNGSNVVNLTK